MGDGSKVSARPDGTAHSVGSMGRVGRSDRMATGIRGRDRQKYGFLERASAICCRERSFARYRRGRASTDCRQYWKSTSREWATEKRHRERISRRHRGRASTKSYRRRESTTSRVREVASADGDVGIQGWRSKDGGIGGKKAEEEGIGWKAEEEGIGRKTAKDKGIEEKAEEEGIGWKAKAEGTGWNEREIGGIEAVGEGSPESEGERQQAFGKTSRLTTTALTTNNMAFERPPTTNAVVVKSPKTNSVAFARPTMSINMEFTAPPAQSVAVARPSTLEKVAFAAPTTNVVAFATAPTNSQLCCYCLVAPLRPAPAAPPSTSNIVAFRAPSVPDTVAPVLKAVADRPTSRLNAEGIGLIPGDETAEPVLGSEARGEKAARRGEKAERRGEKAVKSEEDDGAENRKGVGKDGAVDLSSLIETALVIFQDG